jgi:beta-1,4-mannosyl-glycoprotein beta-1,4-N-acetylglucosaminyltransferase
MIRIYDAFTFYNELDLLELRLEELYDYVDYFVIVESDRTFTNIPKPYYFEDNKNRYSKYLDKIRHFKITSPGHKNPWDNECHQRNELKRGCSDADDCRSIVQNVERS